VSGVIAAAFTTQRIIGLVVAWVTLIAVAVYAFVNIRKAKAEVGNEVDLAPNRKPYYSDEVLEGPRLDRYLTMALVLLGIVALGLPLYWLAEPGRQSGQVDRFEAVFASRGEGLYNANCSSCHGQGGGGGVAAYVLQDREGDFIANVSWKAPQLSTALLRFEREEIQYVLDHGRAFSPMQPWSTVGGGAMNTQQIKNLVDYMNSVALSTEEAQDEVRAGIVARLTKERELLVEESKKAAVGPAVQKAFDDNDSDIKALIALGEASTEREASLRLGELLFSLDTGSGGYSCARCHTAGWSYDRPAETGGGAFGPKLWNVDDKFTNTEQLARFLGEGCEMGKLYGRQSQCKSGQMPGFGKFFSAEQLDAVAAYVETLDGMQQYYPSGQRPVGTTGGSTK